jgi:hypothetical protein
MRSTDFPFAVMPRRFDKGGPSFADRARTVAKGATFAFNDEIEAGLRALAQLDPAAYQREVARIRAQQAAYEESNKAESFGLEMAGGLLPALLPGGQGVAATRMAALAAKAPRLARIAPAIGGAVPVLGEAALYGVGAADSMADIPRSIGEEALFGLGMYGAGATLGPPLKALGVKAANAVGDRVLGPRVVNRIVPEPNPAAKTNMLEGRALNSPEQVRYAQRLMSEAELEDAIKRGRFVVPRDGTKFSAPGQNQKWWSAADDEGIFGRPWNRSDAKLVRLPVGKVPRNRAAATKNAEVWDSEAGEFRKLLAVKKGR